MVKRPMTPLQKTLSHTLPAPLVLPALTMIYGLLIVGIIISAASVQPNIYLDVGGAG